MARASNSGEFFSFDKRCMIFHFGFFNFHRMKQHLLGGRKGKGGSFSPRFRNVDDGNKNKHTKSNDTRTYPEPKLHCHLEIQLSNHFCISRNVIKSRLNVGCGFAFCVLSRLLSSYVYTIRGLYLYHSLPLKSGKLSSCFGIRGIDSSDDDDFLVNLRPSDEMSNYL